MEETTLEDSIAHLHATFDLKIIGPAWTDVDFAAYEAETGNKIPSQLEELLRAFGTMYTEWDDNFQGRPWFLAEFENGMITKNEVHELVSVRETMVTSHRIFRMDTVWPDRFPHDMVFFGAANNNICL